jgi:hypothetical protein
MLDGIQRSSLSARTDTARKKIATRLEQLTSQFADTDAARQAKNSSMAAPSHNIFRPGG